MNLWLIGMNHRSAPVEVREQLRLCHVDARQYLVNSQRHFDVSSIMVLSTCNRVEIYLADHQNNLSQQKIFDYFQGQHAVPHLDLKSYVYIYTNEQVVKHLFRVAASLDSQVVGEAQILGQVKAAYSLAKDVGTLDKFMDQLLQKSFEVSKKIRHETEIGRLSVSIGFVAVELAKRLFDSLSASKAMILGAGEMAEVCAKALAGRGVQTIYFSNRTYDHALSLARRFSGIPVGWGDHLRYLVDIDLCVVSTGAPHFLISAKDVAPIIAQRRFRPMLFVDISVPRNIDPDIAELENVYLYNIDDLNVSVDANRDARQQAASLAEEVVAKEVYKFSHSACRYQLTPLVENVQRKSQQAVDIELRRLRKRLTKLSPGEHACIERSLTTLANKLLSEPMNFLFSDTTTSDVERKYWFERMFRLSEAISQSEDDEDGFDKVSEA